MKFTEDHEWVMVDDNGEAVVGITDYAQEQLGEIVYVELPETGSVVNQGDEAAVVESVKAAGEVKSPISGEIVAVNTALADAPGAVNSDPTGDGWFYRIKPSALSELDDLKDAQAYQTYIESLT